MEKSPLRFLKDYDIITILNELVPKSRMKYNINYHNNLYNNRNKYDNYMNKLIINSVFLNIMKKRELCRNLSFISPIYPFYNNGGFKVNHAVNIYERNFTNLKYVLSKTKTDKYGELPIEILRL